MTVDNSLATRMDCSAKRDDDDVDEDEIEIVDVSSQRSYNQVRLMRTKNIHFNLHMKFMNCRDLRKHLHLIYDTVFLASPFIE